MRARVLLVALLICCLTGPAPARTVPAKLSGSRVTVPRAWLGAVDALILAHKQTGLTYAVVPRRLRGTVGPYRIGEQEDLDDLVAAVAKATGTVAHVVNGVTVLDPADTREIDVPDDLERHVRQAVRADANNPPAAGSAPAELLRKYVRRMVIDGRSGHVPVLSRLAWHEAPSVRYQALAALVRLEGDFLRNQWPGRVSIFEAMRDKLHRQALLWALSEGYRDGSSGWKMAVDVLARSREPYLARHTWVPVWYKTPEAMRLSLWAMGRSGDPTAGRSLDKRVRNAFTNHPEDRYLAAVALGELNESYRLCRGRTARHRDPDVRRAAALGLGLCQPSNRVLDQLDRFLEDEEAGVRFVACLSLGRLAGRRSVGRLLEIVGDADRPSEMRVAALEGLALAGTADATAAIVAACRAPAVSVRARAAETLGRLGGPTARKQLTPLLHDSDRWVRCAAVCAIGRLGSREAVAAAGRAALDADAGPDERIAAMIGLGAGRSPLAKTALSRIALDVDQHRRLRRYAVLALAQLANRSGQEAVRKLAVYGTPGYMPFALTHVRLETPEKTAKFAGRFLARGHRSTSAGAATRLMTLGAGWGVRELLEGYDVFDNHARNMHMWGAVAARGPEVIPALVKATRSRRASIRRAAAMALGGRRDVAAVDALVALTGDRSAGVRASAARALGLCGDPKALPHLVRLAEKDDSLSAAVSAVRALRLRDFSHHDEARELFQRMRGTPRDCGVIDADRPSLTDQPANSFVLRRWAGSIEDDTMCNVTYETSMTYDSHRRRVVLWGAHGRRYDAPQTGQTWFFHPDSGHWNRLYGSHERPNATCCVWGLTYDPANQAVLSPTSGRGGHGWVNALRVNMQYSLPWLLDCRRNEWVPVKPANHKGGHTGMPNGFDRRHALSYWWHGGGKLRAYDAYSNEWWSLAQTGDARARRAGKGGARFDPKTGRYIILGARTVWAYDPAKQTWTDLGPEGQGLPGGLTVYDSANDVMLQFRAHKGKGVEVAAYHLRENRWERLPMVHPSPHYGTFDVAYHAAHNVTVFSGGHQFGSSAEPTVRETWTYRYKPAPETPGALGRPRALRVVTKPGGAADLSWKPPAAGQPRAYRIYRGVGRQAWRVEWKKIAERKPGRELAHTDKGLKAKTQVFYRVVPIGGDGEEGPASYPGRTAPRPPRRASAIFDGDGVRVTWAASPNTDVVGYHVYRAPVAATSYWGDVFNPAEVRDDLKRITEQPVKATEFLDRAAKIDGPACEYAWPRSYAYAVRAVNALGVESGPGPTTLALPDPPGRVRVVPWLDGRRLVLWSPCRGKGVRGYFVMRQDDWNRGYAFRWHAAPIVGFGFWDDREFPREDRRKYHVYGVDAAGAVGIPSSGAWSHGLP
ncbi:MAG: HEAT repeat domain-containing protein [Planctomycetota bacterium]